MYINQAEIPMILHDVSPGEGGSQGGGQAT